jgi:hypothetical protein
MITEDGLEFRYMYHFLQKWLTDKYHRDDFGAMDTSKDTKLSVVDVNPYRGQLGYHLKSSYDRDFELLGFSNNTDNIKKIKSMTNVFNKIGYYDITKNSGKLPFDKKVDILIGVHALDNLDKETGLKFLDEVKRVSHNAIITIPNNKIWSYKDLKTNGDWSIRGFGWNFPKNRNPTTLDTIMSPIVFGFSKYKFYFWARTIFGVYEGSSMNEIQGSIQ